MSDTIWTNEKIEKEILRVVEKEKLKTFPTHSLMNKSTGAFSLSCAISKHGGTEYWAKKLGLEIKRCESQFGKEKELYCMEYIENNFGFYCELCPPRHPYDILVNENIKIDVKVSRLYKGATGRYYTFNLEKKMPTCDIFVCYCVDDEDNIKKTLIIPSCYISGLTQLSLGEMSTRYNKFVDKWEYLNTYDEFYREVNIRA